MGEVVKTIGTIEMNIFIKAVKDARPIVNVIVGSIVVGYFLAIMIFFLIAVFFG